MPFLTTPDGVRLYYETIGKGEPLLLVGGRNSDHHIWNLVRRDFAKRYQVIVYDQRGTGQSDKPEQPSYYSTRIFAADAVAILDHLQIRRVHAYGVSMGGAICQWLGVDYADRIGALVIACANAGQSHGVPPSQEIKDVMAGKDNSKALGLMFSKSIGFNQLQFFYSMRESVKEQMPAYAEEFHALASREHDAWNSLPNIAAPTLIIQGSDDQVCRIENAKLLAERIPNAELHIFDSGRHMFFIEFRRRVDRLILDFLRHHPLRSM
jgi:pimeloyl-ACP methyl ester carboxylesterase